MTALATLGREAGSLVGRLPEPRRRRLQEALVELCGRHWQELRGKEPAAPLARALWAITPPLADLLADLAARRNGRLASVLEGGDARHGFALLTLWALEHNDAEGARAAHAPMMLFATPEAGQVYAEQVAGLLRGGFSPPQPHPHAALPPLARALSLIAAATGRCDVPAVRETLRLLADANVRDPVLDHLRTQLAALGVEFALAEDGEIHVGQRGHRRRRLTPHQLAGILARLRATWLGLPE